MGRWEMKYIKTEVVVTLSKVPIPDRWRNNLAASSQIFFTIYMIWNSQYNKKLFSAVLYYFVPVWLLARNAPDLQYVLTQFWK